MLVANSTLSAAEVHFGFRELKIGSRVGHTQEPLMSSPGCSRSQRAGGAVTLSLLLLSHC